MPFNKDLVKYILENQNNGVIYSFLSPPTPLKKNHKFVEIKQHANKE